MVRIAGTGLAKSSTRSICPSAIRWSRNQCTDCSMNGRIFSTAPEEKNGVSARRNARWYGPSTSPMPSGGWPCGRGTPISPW